MAYPPHKFLSWEGRFDDPRSYLPPAERFRTLYLARRRRTALREVLQDVRHDARAVAEFRSIFATLPPRPKVAAQWRTDRRVGKARIDLNEDQVVDLEDLKVRRALEERHAPLLAAHGMRHLDISQLRSPQRIVTQTIALELHAMGIGGILYRSTLDGEVCVALFEGRATARPYGANQAIDADDEDLLVIAREWHLEIESRPGVSGSPARPSEEPPADPSR